MKKLFLSLMLLLAAGSSIELSACYFGACKTDYNCDSLSSCDTNIGCCVPF
jgi:hypothetical protein